MRTDRPSAALTAAALLGAAALLLTGCSGSSGGATPSASSSDVLNTPAPANPALADGLLTPKDMPKGWKYLLFNGANGMTLRPCDTGAVAAAKVGLISGPHVLVEDGTLFDSTANASAFIKREATGADCARAATASPAPRTDLGLAAAGDESYSFKVTGTVCNEIVLIRKGALVAQLVTPCA